MQELISHIFDRHYGKPILVIGGGASVLADLPLLPEGYFSAVISANDHGLRQMKFPVDYAHSVDRVHIERKMPMREFMRAFRTPTINRLSWADFRLPNWKLVTNSGLSAITVAAVLGGHPIVTTGIDLWVGGNVYFHRVRDKHRASPSRDGVKNKMRELGQWCEGAVLRSLSGPVAEHHGVFDPAEILPEVVAHSYRSVAGPTIHAVARKDFMMGPGDSVMAGTKLAFLASEWRRAQLRWPVDKV